MKSINKLCSCEIIHREHRDWILGKMLLHTSSWDCLCFVLYWFFSSSSPCLGWRCLVISGPSQNSFCEWPWDIQQVSRHHEGVQVAEVSLGIYANKPQVTTTQGHTGSTLISVVQFLREVVQIHFKIQWDLHLPIRHQVLWNSAWWFLYNLVTNWQLYFCQGENQK